MRLKEWIRDCLDGPKLKNFLYIQIIKLQDKTFMNNKFNAKKQIYKGLKFDSKKELHRYLVLEKLLKG